MSDNTKSWPSEVFTPVYQRIWQRFYWRKTTHRRIAKMTKGVLAAQAALEHTMSRNPGGQTNETVAEDC